MTTDDGYDDGYDDDLDETIEPAGQAPDEAAPAGKAADTEGEAPKPLFADFSEFVVKLIGPTISRKVSQQSGGSVRWDPDWWRYPEVVMRMEIMWRTFEVARRQEDPNVLESWFRQVLDYHLGVIMSPNGPMTNATGPSPTLGATYPKGDPRAAVDKQKAT